MRVRRNLVVGKRKINAALVKSYLSNYEKLLITVLWECEMGGPQFGIVQFLMCHRHHNRKWNKMRTYWLMKSYFKKYCYLRNPFISVSSKLHSLVVVFLSNYDLLGLFTLTNKIKTADRLDQNLKYIVPVLLKTRSHCSSPLWWKCRRMVETEGSV